MASSGNVVIKTTADAGNTVLFETTGTGGSLRISVDGDNWFIVGGDTSSGSLSRYAFASPLIVDSTNQVSLKIANNDEVGVNEPLSVVAVGANGVIGENLLPGVISRLKYLWDEDYIVLKSKLPDDVVYLNNGEISDELLSDNVALWDAASKTIEAEHLPDNIAYLSDAGKLPVSALPDEAVDIWEDLTDGVRMQE